MSPVRTLALLSATSLCWGQSGSPLQRLASYPVTPGAGLVATADFNGDGKLDVIVLDTDQPEATIFFGNGNGTLTLHSDLTLPLGTDWLTVGDVNGDGIPDLVTTQFDPRTVTILLGNGDGSFHTGSQYATLLPSSIGLADLNHDGKPDLIVAGGSDGMISVFIARGDGNFLPPVSYAVPGAASLTSGDFNGDGYADVAVASSLTDNTVQPPHVISSVSFLLGLGGGALAAPITVPFPPTPFGVAAADFNGDGRADLAVQGFFNNILEVFFGAASGTFPSEEISESKSALVAVAADFDGDGLPDIATTGTGGGNFLLNRGSGAFVESAGISATLLASATGDLNGDGKPDLVALETSSAGTLVAVFLNDAVPWTASITAAPTSLTYPNLITLSVNIAADGPTFAAPASEVTWLAGQVVLGTSTTVQANGTISATLITVLAPGAYSISVQCAGVGKFNPVSVIVEKAATMATAMLTTVLPISGSPITIRTSVAPASSVPFTPSGTVTLQDGATPVASAILDTSGQAIAIIPSLSPGIHFIQVNYSGDPYFGPSAASITVVVAAPLVALSAASYTPASAPQSIVALYGSNLAATNLEPNPASLPVTLNGIEVLFIDASGQQSPGPIYFLSPNQINAVVPSLGAGTALVQILNNGVPSFGGPLTVAPVAPGFFSANGNGKGAAAASLLTVDAAGNQSSQLIFSCASAGNCETVPLNVGDSSVTYFLIFYGTGFRGAAHVTVTIGGTPAQVLFFGAQPQFPGLDQINVQLPSGIPGGSDLAINSTADGIESNEVTIRFQ